MRIFTNAKNFLIAGLLIASSMAQAAVITHSTAESKFDSGTLNQGWWATNTAAAQGNDNYITGSYGGSTYRSFFTFDLSDIIGKVTSATLRIQRGDQTGTANLEFFDVSTAASVVNNNSSGMNSSIFNDLGTGTSYGSFQVNTGSFSEYLSFSLNAAALSDINKAKIFLTIGATNNSSQFIFGSSATFVTYLDLNTTAAAVPEPTTVALLGLGLLGFAASRRRSAKSKNA